MSNFSNMNVSMGSHMMRKPSAGARAQNLNTTLPRNYRNRTPKHKKQKDNDASRSNSQINEKSHLIPNPTRLTFYNPCRRILQNELIDVIFQVEGLSRIGAHKFILIDTPEYELFHEKLHERAGVVTINIPIDRGIRPSSIDRLLNYIYGIEFEDLGITNRTLPSFSNTLMFFKANAHVIWTIFQKLLTTVGLDPGLLESFANCYSRKLYASPKFWLLDLQDLQRWTKMDLPSIKEKLMDLMSIDKTNRDKYLKKVIELQQILDMENACRTPHPHRSSGIEQESESPVVSDEGEITLTEMNRNDGVNYDLSNDHDQIRDDLSVDSIRFEDELSIITVDELEDFTESSTTQDEHSSNDDPGSTGPISPATVRRTGRIRRNPRRLSDSANGNLEASCSFTIGRDTLSVSLPRLQLKHSLGDLDSVNAAASFAKRANIANGRDNPPAPRMNLSLPLGNYRKTGLETVRLKDPMVKIHCNLCNPYSSFDQEFLEAWKTLLNYTTIFFGRCSASSCQRFLGYGGLELIIKSREKYPNPDGFNSEFSQVLLGIIENCVKSRIVRNLVFKDDVVQFALKELELQSDFTIAMKAGEILAVFLDSYGYRKWNTLPTNRAEVLFKLRNAIEKCGLSSNCDNLQTFKRLLDFVNLIRGKDPGAQLFGLWALNYYTQTDSSVDERNAIAWQHVTWLEKTKFQNQLKRLYAQDDDYLISKYAKLLLKALGYPIHI